MNELEKIEFRMGQIGTICGLWSHLEYMLAATIWHLLKIDDEDIGIIVVGGLGIEQRANMAHNLALKLSAPPDLIAVLATAKTDIREIAGERNLAVHGVYGLNTDTMEISATVHRGKYRGTKQPITLERLQQIIQEIHSIIDALDPILVSHGVWPELMDEHRTSLKKSLSRIPTDDPTQTQNQAKPNPPPQSSGA